MPTLVSCAGAGPLSHSALTPPRMLELGVFGGAYFHGTDVSEYPAAWFEKAKISDHGFDIDLNHFRVEAGLSYEEWKRRGWIMPEDPLGWFQWYCRFFQGRRLPEVDAIQIRRWRAFGPRHIGAIRAQCAPEDMTCRRRQRQALLQWAYDPFF